MLKFKEFILAVKPGEILRELHKRGELEAILPMLTALDINDELSKRHKNNFYHSIKVLEQAIALEDTGPDLILRTAALFHDVGKPATRKLESTGAITFQQHEIVGAKQARSFLKELGFSKHENDEVTELISNHMRSFNFDVEKWTDAGMRRLLRDISTPLQLQRLFKIFKADVTTRFDNKRKAIYKRIDELENNVERVRLEEIKASRRPALNGNEIMELLELKPGPELGRLMKFLNTEEGLRLTKDEAIARVKEML